MFSSGYVSREHMNELLAIKEGEIDRLKKLLAEAYEINKQYCIKVK